MDKLIPINSDITEFDVTVLPDRASVKPRGGVIIPGKCAANQICE